MPVLTEKRYSLQIPVFAGAEVLDSFVIRRGVTWPRTRPERTTTFTYVNGITYPIYTAFNPQVREKILGYMNAGVAGDFNMNAATTISEGGIFGKVDGVFLMFGNKPNRIGLEQQEETTGQAEAAKKVMDLYERIITRVFCESFTGRSGEIFPSGQLVNRLLNVSDERIFEADMLLLQALGSLDGLSISQRAHALMENPGDFRSFSRHLFFGFGTQP